MVILSPPIQTQKNVLHGLLYGLGFGFSAKLLVYAVYTDMPYVLLYHPQTCSKLVHSPLPRPKNLAMVTVVPSFSSIFKKTLKKLTMIRTNKMIFKKILQGIRTSNSRVTWSGALDRSTTLMPKDVSR